MSPRFVVAAALASALAAQQVQLPAAVRFGAAFEVIVDARGRFDPARLAPLSVEVVAREPTADGERLRLRARCYELGAVELALEPPRTLQVETALPDPPGELEWPADGYELPRAATSPWLVAGLSLLALVGAYAALRRARARGVPAQPASATPAWSAAAALRALEAAEGDEQAFFSALKGIVRRHCAEHLGVASDARTSEELLAALPRAREPLDPCLRCCDLALFSQLPDRLGSVEPSRARALRFVEATEEGGA